MGVATKSRPATSFDSFHFGYGCLLIVAALVMGGGGAEGPILNGLLEALAAPLLVAAIASHFSSRPLPSTAVWPVWGAVILLALFLLQMIPLPPVVWRALPGRELASEVAQLTAQSASWKPLSLDPDATRRSAAALILPLAFMLFAVRSDGTRILWVVRALLAGAASSALLGAVQIARGSPSSLTIYGDPVAGVGTGFFANPNHQASLMLLSLVAVGLFVRLQSPNLKMHIGARVWRFKLGWLLAPLFIVADIATQSRAGLLLLLPAIAFAALIASEKKSIRSLTLIGGVTLAAILAVLLFTRAGFWQMLPSRAQFLRDARATSIPDILYTLRQYWPWGSGFGTFVPVFMANEDLDLAQAAYLNHAHNDYLEFLIEGGLPAAIALTAALLAISWRIVRIFRETNIERAPALAGFAMLVLLAAHSLVDYPLRTDGITMIAGLALGLLFSELPRKSSGRSSSRGKRGFSSLSSGVARGGSSQ